MFLSLFMLVDKDSILAYFNRIVPPQWSDEALLFETSVASSFGGFIRGQVGQGLVMSVIAIVVHIAFGLDFTPVSAAVTGILQAIPFFGPAFAWLPPVVIALLSKPDVVLPVTIAMLIGWFVVNNVLAPRLMATAWASRRRRSGVGADRPEGRRRGRRDLCRPGRGGGGVVLPSLPQSQRGAARRDDARRQGGRAA